MQSEVAGRILHFVQTDAALPNKRQSRGFVKVGYIYMYYFHGQELISVEPDGKLKVRLQPTVNLMLPWWELINISTGILMHYLNLHMILRKIAFLKFSSGCPLLRRLRWAISFILQWDTEEKGATAWADLFWCVQSGSIWGRRWITQVSPQCKPFKTLQVYIFSVMFYSETHSSRPNENVSCGPCFSSSPIKSGAGIPGELLH